MTAPARRLAPPFAAALWYGLRVCVPPRRWLLLFIPCVGAVLFGLLGRATGDGTAAEAFEVTARVLFSLVLPLACLVVGDAVLGAEVRSGTFALTWLSPLSFARIVAARWLAGWIISCVVLLPATVLATVTAGMTEAAGAMAVATLAGSAAYVALFVLFGAATRRAVLWSLGAVLLVERLLGTALDGIAQLSPQWLALSAYAGLGPTDGLARDGVPTGGAAVLRLVAITAVLLLIAVRATRRVTLSPGDD